MKGKAKKIISLLLIAVIVTILIVIKNMDKNDLKNTETINNSNQKATVRLLENDNTIGVTGLTVESDVTIFVGEGKQLNASVLPGTATDKRLTWTSDNTKVAMVYSNGYVRGLSIGTATITVTSVANPEIKKTIFVRITEVTARTINVNKVELDLEVGDTDQLTATVLPSTIKNKAVTWRTSNSKIATVDTAGKVKAIGVGTATITITSAQNPNVTKTVRVKVSKKTEVTISTSIKSVEMYIGETRQISISNNSAISASKRSIIWSSQNIKVATAQTNGMFTALVKGVSSGTTTVVATSPINPNDKIAIQVVVKDIDVRSITTNVERLELAIGESKQIETTVNPSNATNKKLKFSILSDKIAGIDHSGKVWGRKEGATELIITSVQNPSVMKRVFVVVKEVPLTRIDLNVDELTLRVGETAEIQATYVPENSKYTAGINWIMKNSKIARIITGHMVEAVSEGTTTLTIKSTKYPKVTKKITINVIGENATSVTFEKKNYELGIGSKIKLNPTVKPETADLSKLEWISANSSIAKVYSDGTVEGLKVGTTSISIRKKEDKKILGIVVVTVKKARVSVEEITISNKNITLEPGKNYQTQVLFVPPTATNKNLTWQTSNSKVAKVNAKGVIKGVEEGTATITITSLDNSNAKETINVTVKKEKEQTLPVEDISVNTDEVTLGVGTSYNLVASVQPSNAIDKKLIWKSKNTKIATVSETGKITGMKQGTTKVTVTSNENKKIDKEIKVYVKNNFIPVSSIDVEVGPSKENVNQVTQGYKEGVKYINKGDEFKITATAKPEDATNKELTWKVKDEKVISVDKDGTVKALKKGYTTIKISSKSNKYISQTVYVAVLEPVTDIKIKNKSGKEIEYITLREGRSTQLRATVLPTSASNRNVIWESNNPEIVTVDQKGNIKALKEGNATISAISDGDNTKHAEISVLVGDKIGKIYFLSTQYKRLEGDNIIESLINTITNKVSEENTSIVLKSSTGKLALVNTAENGVCNYIKEQLQKISGEDKITLEYLIITLADEKHAGCYEDIINDKDITVKNVVLKETNEEYKGQNYFEYMKDKASNKGINVINTQELSEGNKLSLENINIKLYNNQNIFKGKKERCEWTINNETFSNMPRASALNKFDYAIVVPKTTLYMVASKDGDYTEFISGRDTIKSYTRRGYVLFVGNKNKNALACDEKANSLALLIEITDNNGQARSYAYLPSSIENNGYPVQGTEERKNYKTIISDKIIYGNGSTYGIYVTDRVINNKHVYEFIEPTSETVFKDTENKVSEQIAKDIGQENLKKIKIYQASNYGYSVAKNTLENLGLVDSNGTRLNSFYTIIEGNYKKYDKNEYIVWRNSRTYSINGFSTFSNKTSWVECFVTDAGGTACNTKKID